MIRSFLNWLLPTPPTFVVYAVDQDGVEREQFWICSGAFKTKEELRWHLVVTNQSPVSRIEEMK